MLQKHTQRTALNSQQQDFYTTGKPLNRQKGRKRFAFTNSTSTLSHQFVNKQFGQIIKEKKVYQSMIKDEIGRLEKLDSVCDPQIQPFQVEVGETNTKDDIKKNDNSQNKQRSKRAISKAMYEHLDTQQYLDKEVDKKFTKRIKNHVQKLSFLSLIKGLQLNLQKNKKHRAARYFNYSHLLNKYLHALKTYSISHFQIDEQLVKKNNHLNIAILKKNLSIFMSSISAKICKSRSKQLNFKYIQNKKTINLRYIRDLYVRGINIQQKINLCQNKTKTNCLKTMMHQHSKTTSLKVKTVIIQNKNNKIYKLNFIKKINNFCSSRKTQDNQFLLINLKPELRKKIQNKAKSQYFSLLSKQNQINKSYKALVNLQNKKTIKKFINQFSSQHTSLKKQKMVFSVWKKFYLTTFLKNSSSDISFSKSILKCLSGSKKWLAKNKHIFKIFPAAVHSQIQQNVFLQHPLYEKNNYQLLEMESKYKKRGINFIKRLFITQMKKLLARKKKVDMAKYVINQLKNTRRVKSIFNILKNKQMISQLKRKIQQQQQQQFSQEQRNESNQFLRFFLTNQKLQFYKNLQRFRNCQKQKYSLKLLKYYVFVDRLKNHHYSILKNLSSDTARLKLQKFIKHLNFTKLKAILINNKQFQSKKNQFVLSNIESSQRPMQKSQSNLFVNSSYLQIGSQLITKNIKSRCVRQLQQQLSVSKSQIKVTCLYLKNRLKRMIENKNFYVQLKIKKTQQYISIQLIHQIVIKNKLKTIFLNFTTRKQILNARQSIIAENSKKYLIKSLNKFKQNSQRVAKIQQIKYKTELLEQTNSQNMKAKFFNHLKTINQVKGNIQIANNEANNSELKQSKKQEHSLIDSQIKLETNINEVKNPFGEDDEQQNNFQQIFDNSCGSQLFQSAFSIEKIPNNNNENIYQNAYQEQQDSSKKSIEKYLPNNSPKQEEDFSDKYLSYEQYRKSIENLEDYQQQQPQEESTQHQENKQIENIHEVQEQDQQFSHNAEQTQQSESQITNNYQYFENRYTIGLTKKCFESWKFFIENKQKECTQSFGTLKKVFQGLKMFSKQKFLVRKYLKQYEQQLHYYPQSSQQYNQFAKITGKV